MSTPPNTVKIEVNGRSVDAVPGETLLKTLRRVGIHVPTLCYYDGLPPSGACRICVVEVEGQRSLVPSCAFPVAAGMKVKTHSDRAVEARRMIIELLLADHPDDCLFCERNGNCQLRELAESFGIRRRRFVGQKSEFSRDFSGESIVRDPEKCIKCGKCVRVCEEVQGVACIDFINRGSKTTIGTAFDEGMNVSSCVNCGQCVTACPTGALVGKSHIKRIIAALRDPNLHVVVQHAPSVSIALGEEFGFAMGSDVMGMMHAALRQMGFDRVFDTSFSADLTIMEEATELVHRVKTGGVLPMFTSCSPGWIKYVETFYPQNIPNLSSCKSPQAMLGAVIKTYYAEKNNLDPKKIFSVSVMPCTAKKFEASRPEMGRSGYQDVDAVLTTRELAQMIRRFDLDLKGLQPEPADTPFGVRSSAGKIFGVTGGVMEAAIRSAYHFLTGEELSDLKVEAVRGLNGIKEAHVNINGLNVGVAVVNGLGNAKRLLDQINSGEKSDIHFVEVMTCPGGCVGGGGQPYGTDLKKVKTRTQGLYNIDDGEKLRVSHANPEIVQIYKEYLGEPNSHKSHELLHTHYHERETLT
ncbi:MAG: [FeFe] hydrogenase, group A [Planctomycetaceae bacterium]|jgi:iron-only hydrogenase group A|nr:[FeFe] hydrogenase, group A [Planctomycetaceae bacterium]